MQLGHVSEIFMEASGQKQYCLKKYRLSFCVEFDMATTWLNRLFKKKMKAIITIMIVTINLPDIAST